jgi:acyl-CoA dehydrogenase
MPDCWSKRCRVSSPSGAGPEQRQGAEVDGWAEPCWQALAEAGLPWVGVPESAGGSGGDAEDACTLVQAAGRHARTPSYRRVHPARWLVAGVGRSSPSGWVRHGGLARAGDYLTLDRTRLSGRLNRVPW